MEKKFFYLSGLPRSGSTVLASIISQNPQIYCSPTSVLVGLLQYTRQVQDDSDQVKSYNVEGQFESMMMGLINGLYHHVDRPYIIDKNRAQINPINVNLLNRIFKRDPKIICTVRSVVDVLASFIKLIRKNPSEVSFIDRSLIKLGVEVNDENRLKQLMSPDGHVFQSWSVIKQGYESNYEHVLYVEYENLIMNPLLVMRRIYKFLEIDQFDHDFDNITNEVQEDDSVYFLPGMHIIRKELALSLIHI